MRHVRPLVPLLLCTALSACDVAPPPTSGDDPQAAELAALEAQTGAPWTVRYHADVHTPAFLEGRSAPMVARSSEAPSAARRFLTAHGALFRIADVQGELRSAGTVVDELGMIHVRFQQQQGGVPVLGGEITTHFDGDGALVRVHGRYAPLPPVELVPAVVQTEARRAALAAATAARGPAGGTAAPPMTADTPALVIDPSSPQQPRLAWRIDVLVEDPVTPGRLEVMIDASTAEPYRLTEQLDDLTGSGQGVFGDVESLEITEHRGRYWLEDGNAGDPPQRTYTAGGSTRLPGAIVSSDRTDRWDDSGPAPGAAVDAHAYVRLATAYYAKTHGRAGALGDGRGLRATVHYGSRYPNAFWNGKQLVFGDGDGVEIAPLAGALDVVAHELTHAVIESSSHLGHRGEPGALNEAIADVFGAFVEHAVRGRRANWTVGEDVISGGLRDLAAPHRLGHPAHVSEQIETREDRGGVHFNSTIPSHAAWLMTAGGTNAVSRRKVTGVGITASQRIWYRALVRYLRANATFRDCADATLAAARDLYGASSSQRAAVRDAWEAVGVL